MDRLASEEPEAEIEIGQETRISFTAEGVEITQDPGAEFDHGHAFRYASRGYKSQTMDGRKVETWTNAVDQGMAHYAVDVAGQRMAVMVKRRVLPHTTYKDTGRQNTFFFFLQQNDEHGQW